MLQILDYLEAYTDYFGFRQHIIFQTEVISIEQLPDNVLRVTTRVRILHSHRTPAFPGEPAFNMHQEHLPFDQHS